MFDVRGFERETGTRTGDRGHTHYKIITQKACHIKMNLIETIHAMATAIVICIRLVNLIVYGEQWTVRLIFKWKACIVCCFVINCQWLFKLYERISGIAVVVVVNYVHCTLHQTLIWLCNQNEFLWLFIN